MHGVHAYNPPALEVEQEELVQGRLQLHMEFRASLG